MCVLFSNTVVCFIWNTKYVGKHKIGDKMNDNIIASLQCDNAKFPNLPFECLYGGGQNKINWGFIEF